MKLLWHSNSPWASTGYGVQTALFMPRIRERLGYEVAHSSLFGLQGGMLGWNGIPCYPSGFDQVGHDSMPAHAQHFGAEVIVTLFDAWCMQPGAIQSRGARWVPWFPIDSEPIPAAVLRQVRESWQPIVFSRFGERMAAEAGLATRYVPHGVDTSIYRARDKAAERAQRGLPDVPAAAAEPQPSAARS